MPADTRERADLLKFLSKHGWRETSSGPVGDLWESRDASVLAGIPFGITDSSPEWAGIIDRAAAGSGKTPESVQRALQGASFDEILLKVDGPDVGPLLPIEPGVDLYESARRLLRASATTSRGPKPVIGGNYSKAGDAIVDEARFGQSRVGSYVVPLLVPVVDVEITEDPAGEKPFEESTLWAVPETNARRATRTMAEALTALHSQVVVPDRDPTSTTVGNLTIAGVSRELVQAVANVVSRSAVSSFKTSFEWSWATDMKAPAATDPIDFPSSSSTLLRETALKFRRDKKPEVEVFTGPIVEMRDDKALKFASIAVETTRKGRRAEIHVTVTGEQRRRAHEWFAAHETLRLEGHVTTDRQRLWIQSPQLLAPLRTTFAVDADA